MIPNSDAMLLDATQDNDADFWGTHLRGQIYLGDEDFAERMRAQATPTARLSPEVPARQRLPVAQGLTTWLAWLQAHNSQLAQALHAALHAAYHAGWKSMPGLAAECGLSAAHVSRLVRAMEAAKEP